MENERGIHFCCPFMDELVLSAGKRGSSVIVEIGPFGPRCVLQSRGVDWMATVPTSSESQRVINLCSSVVISYCPSCGAMLRGVLERHPDWTRSLAQGHQQFVQKII